MCLKVVTTTTPRLRQRPSPTHVRTTGGEQKSNAAFLLSQEKLRKRKELEVARESVAERRRLAEDAAEFERSQRREAWRARKAGRALRNSRREQVQVKSDKAIGSRKGRGREREREITTGGNEHIEIIEPLAMDVGKRPDRRYWLLPFILVCIVCTTRCEHVVSCVLSFFRPK